MFPDLPSQCVVLFYVMLLNLNWTRTAAAGRKKRNDFLSIVAEFRTLWSYREVDGGPDLPRVHPGEDAQGSSRRHQSTSAGTMRRD